MKNYTLILLLAIALLVNGEYSYAQPSSDIDIEKVVVKRYGLTYATRILDFVYEFVYPLGDSPASAGKNSGCSIIVPERSETISI